jgi:hypothetical protein
MCTRLQGASGSQRAATIRGRYKPIATWVSDELARHRRVPKRTNAPAAYGRDPTLSRYRHPILQTFCAQESAYNET